MKGETATMRWMEEGRKRVLLAQFEGGKSVPATMSAIADAVRWAEEIMKAIDGLTNGGPVVSHDKRSRRCPILLRYVFSFQMEIPKAFV